MHVWLIATPVNKAFVLIIETFILEHKHTSFRTRPMKAFKVIKSPEAFIGRVRNDVCLCSKINVSIIKTKALLTGVAISQTCIGTRETDDLRSQAVRRTRPSGRTRRSATLGPCEGWIRGAGGGPYDESALLHLDG